jgi:hypothetical protein
MSNPSGLANTLGDKIDLKFMDIELKGNKDIFSLQKTDKINLLSPQCNTDTDHSISPAIQINAASQHNPQDDMQC